MTATDVSTETDDDTGYALPPGPSLPYPLQTLLFGKYGSTFMPAMRRRYGDMFTLRIAPQGRKLVVITRPELIKQIFTGSSSVFHAGEGNAILGPVMGEHSVLLLDDSEHLRVRQLLMPAFHGAPMHGYRSMMTALADTEAQSWPTGTPFPTHSRTNALALEIILQVVFGVTDESRLSELRPVVDRIVNVNFATMLGVFYPPLQRIPPWRNFMAVQQDLDRLLYAEIADRRRQTDLDERSDVLSRLLCAKSDEPLTDPELRDNLITLLLAGHETTATALAWTFHELARNPDVAARAIAAADSGDEEYLEAVLKESLRMHPVIAAVARTLKEPVEIGGYLLPAGVNVNPGIALMQADANIYPAPERFDPTRFIGTQPAPNTWIPFGGGIRRCLGAGFSLMEGTVILQAVLSRFTMVPDRPEPELPTRRNITLTPSRGGTVVLTRR